jgi:hypothetical protein
MKYRLLGSSELRAPEASLGTMTFGDELGSGCSAFTLSIRMSAAIDVTVMYDAFRSPQYVSFRKLSSFIENLNTSQNKERAHIFSVGKSFQTLLLS